MKKFLKKLVFYSVVGILTPIWLIAMGILFLVAMIIGTLCDWMDDE